MKEKNKLKNVLKSCAPLTYIIPLIIFFYFFYIQLNPIWFAVVSLLPGVYALSMAFIYGEMQSALRGGGTYRGYKAVIISFDHFWFFMLFGLWVPLRYFGYQGDIYDWRTLISAMAVMFVPSLIVYFAGKKDKKPISRINYWIQTPDLNVRDGEQALTLKEA